MVFHTTKMQVPTGLNVHKVPLPQHHISKSLLWNSGEKKMEKENAETHKKIEEHKNEFNSDENHSSDSIDGSPPNSASGVTGILPNPIERDDYDEDMSNQEDRNVEVISNDDYSFLIAQQSQAHWE